MNPCAHPLTRTSQRRVSVGSVPHLELSTSVAASAERCFDVSVDVELHTRSTGAREEIVGDVRSGLIGPGEEVTWRAWHFGVPFRMTSRIAEYDRPGMFVDQQVRGPFGAWRHEHRFEEADGHTVMRDVVDFRSPLGPLGALVDRLVLRRYMTRVLETRNTVLRVAAESSGQH